MAEGKGKNGAQGSGAPSPKEAEIQDGLKDVADMVAAAEPLAADDYMAEDGETKSFLADLAALDPKPGEKLRNSELAGHWHPDEYGLPDECPILPLGTEDGVFWFLDTIGQLRSRTENEFGKAGINALMMGRHRLLYHFWPTFNGENQNKKRWDVDSAREHLMAACGFKGPWSAAEKVRGRGMWKDRDGNLMVHCGDRLLIDGQELQLGEYQGNVYPTRPPLPTPWPNNLTGKPGPGRFLLPHFQSWNWARPELDPVLLIGWLGVGYLGGALDWRSHGYILGDKAVGKSSLQADIKAIMREFLVQSGDTTAAGLYQRLKHDSLAIAVDEFEGKSDNRKQKAVIELARLSSSGAPMNRGGDNHKGTEFHGRSAFLFSSINTPPMDPQDLSRQALMRLFPLQAGQTKPNIPSEDLAVYGRQIQRRLIDNWHRFNETYATWREFLASCGHDGRGQDTFGTLLSIADLIIDADADHLKLDLSQNSKDLESWRDILQSTSLMEYEDATENWRLCLNHVINQRIDAWRQGSRHTVGELLFEFMERDPHDTEAITYETVRKMLEQTGLTVLKPSGKGEKFRLFIPNQNPLLHALYKETKWQGELSAGTWSGALRSAEGKYGTGSARINGSKTRGTTFNLETVFDEEE